MHRNRRVPQHRLRPRRRHHDPLSLFPSLNRIREARDHAELELLLRVVAGDVQQRPAGESFLVDLEVGEGGVELDTPVDEAVGAVEDAVFV